MCFDRLLFEVIHGSHGQIAFGNPECQFDTPEVVVLSDNGFIRLLCTVGIVPFNTQQSLCFFDEGRIERQGGFFRKIYLAVIQNIVSKEIIAFNLSNHHDADLVLKTLKEAVLKTKKPPMIFHSDRGREFLSEKCIMFLENLKVKISVSDSGSP